MTSGLNLNFHQNDSNLIVRTDRPASPGRASGGGAPSFFASLAVRAAAFFRGIWDCVRASSPMPRAQGLDGLPGPGSVTGLEMLAFGKCFAELDPGLRSDTEAVRRLAKGLKALLWDRSPDLVKAMDRARTVQELQTVLEHPTAKAAADELVSDRQRVIGMIGDGMRGNLQQLVMATGLPPDEIIALVKQRYLRYMDAAVVRKVEDGSLTAGEDFEMCIRQHSDLFAQQCLPDPEPIYGIGGISAALKQTFMREILAGGKGHLPNCQLYQSAGRSQADAPYRDLPRMYKGNPEGLLRMLERLLLGEAMGSRFDTFGNVKVSEDEYRLYADVKVRCLLDRFPDLKDDLTPEVLQEAVAWGEGIKSASKEIAWGVKCAKQMIARMLEEPSKASQESVPDVPGRDSGGDSAGPWRDARPRHGGGMARLRRP